MLYYLQKNIRIYNTFFYKCWKKYLLKKSLQQKKLYQLINNFQTSMGTGQTKTIHHHYPPYANGKYCQIDSRQVSAYTQPFRQNQTNKKSENNKYQGNFIYQEQKQERQYQGPNQNPKYPQIYNNAYHQGQKRSPQIQKVPEFKVSENYRRSEMVAEKPKINNMEKEMEIQKNDQIKMKELAGEQQRMLELIKEYEMGIAKARQYAVMAQDPDKYDQFKAEALKIYLQRLKQLNFPDQAVNPNGKCIKLIVGRIAAGKSSLLNTLLNLKLKVGLGQTTLEQNLIHQTDKIQIYDTPGQNEVYNTMNFEVLKKISMANQVLILFPDSLKNSEHLVRAIAAIKPKHTILLRTHCDKVTEHSKRTVRQQIQQDYKILSRWGITGIKIYATSAQAKDKFDNNQVRELILSHPFDKQ